MTVARQYSPHKPQAQKEPSWFLVILLSGVISGVLLFTIGWYVSLPQAQKDAVVHKLLSTKDIFPDILGFQHSRVLLVMGVDMPPRGMKDSYKDVRTDTMMLVKVDTSGRKVNIVSIPRDSKVYIPGYQGVNKINAAFALGGPDLSVATVEQTFGIKVDNYLVLNLMGVREVVDALGGIDVYVEKSMHYRDRTAGLYINLEPGLHHMEGKEAEGYLRFRHDALGDIGRITRQQEFMSAFIAKFKDPRTLLQLKPLIEASNKYILTNMSTQDLIRLALFGKDLKHSDFQVSTVPGHPSLNSSVSYWVIDPQAAETVLNRLIVGIDEQDSGALASGTPTVGILYTPSRSEAVSDYQTRLQSEGFKVICHSRILRSNTKLIMHNNDQTRNTETKLEHTSPELKDAQLIFSPHGATFETNSCGNSDFTIILGDDTRSAVN